MRFSLNPEGILIEDLMHFELHFYVDLAAVAPEILRIQ